MHVSAEVNCHCCDFYPFLCLLFRAGHLCIVAPRRQLAYQGASITHAFLTQVPPPVACFSATHVFAPLLFTHSYQRVSVLWRYVAALYGMPVHVLPANVILPAHVCASLCCVACACVPTRRAVTVVHATNTTSFDHIYNALTLFFEIHALKSDRGCVSEMERMFIGVMNGKLGAPFGGWRIEMKTQ